MPLWRWRVSHNPEKELEEFLASTPAWKQRCLLTGFGSLNHDEIREWSNNLDEDFRLTKEYERILQKIPAKWEVYRKRLQREAQPMLEYFVPKGKPGRKQNVVLAERIWALDAQGRSNREIQETLNAGGENLSLEAVESYLKKRRRPSR
jgi:predicted nucleotide-binding protein (sugar kinase/HSP70/actin superfamily)